MGTRGAFQLTTYPEFPVGNVRSSATLSDEASSHHMKRAVSAESMHCSAGPNSDRPLDKCLEFGVFPRNLNQIPRPLQRPGPYRSATQARTAPTCAGLARSGRIFCSAAVSEPSTARGPVRPRASLKVSAFQWVTGRRHRPVCDHGQQLFQVGGRKWLHRTRGAVECFGAASRSTTSAKRAGGASLGARGAEGKPRPERRQAREFGIAESKAAPLPLQRLRALLNARRPSFVKAGLYRPA
jgi:hypothetical protein